MMLHQSKVPILNNFPNSDVEKSPFKVQSQRKSLVLENLVKMQLLPKRMAMNDNFKIFII